MKFTNTILALTLSGIAIGPSYSFASSQTYGISNNNPAATFNYWTSERLKDAKPIPMPEVNPNQIKVGPVNKSENGNSFSVKGMPPTLNAKIDIEQLFTPGNNLNMTTPNDTGTEGLHFSSSRLVPLYADKSYPYSAVGKLFFSTGSGNFVCSASVVANRLVVTAGHCVHRGSGGTGGFYSNFLFIPAFRDGLAPFQKWAWSYVNTSPAWMNGGGNVPNAGDFALLEMKDNIIAGAPETIANVTGKLGIATQKLAPNHLTLLGYPCNLDSCLKMHQVNAENGPAVAPNNVEYGSDMRGGSSGGPWVQNFGEPATGQTGGLNPAFNQVVGVTSWGYVSTEPKIQGASILDNSFVNLWNELCSRNPGNC